MLQSLNTTVATSKTTANVGDKCQPVLAATYRQGPIRRDEDEVEHDEADNDTEQSDPWAAEQHGSDDREDEDESSRSEAQTVAKREHRACRGCHARDEGDDAWPETTPNRSLLHARRSLGPGRGHGPAWLFANQGGESYAVGNIRDALGG